MKEEEWYFRGHIFHNEQIGARIPYIAIVFVVEQEYNCTLLCTHAVLHAILYIYLRPQDPKNS